MRRVLQLRLEAAEAQVVVGVWVLAHAAGGVHLDGIEQHHKVVWSGGDGMVQAGVRDEQLR